MRQGKVAANVNPVMTVYNGDMVAIDKPHVIGDDRRAALEINFKEKPMNNQMSASQYAKSEEQYVKDGADNCPVCGGANLSYGSTDLNHNLSMPSQYVECDDCWSSWRDTFTITGYMSLEVGDGPGPSARERDSGDDGVEVNQFTWADKIVIEKHPAFDKVKKERKERRNKEARNDN